MKKGNGMKIYPTISIPLFETYNVAKDDTKNIKKRHANAHAGKKHARSDLRTQKKSVTENVVSLKSMVDVYCVCCGFVVIYPLNHKEKISREIDRRRKLKYIVQDFYAESIEYPTVDSKAENLEKLVAEYEAETANKVYQKGRQR